MTTGAAVALAVAGTAALGWLYRRDHSEACARRDGFFDVARNALETPEIMTTRGDYPVLRGTREGYRTELRALADTIQLRKLPILWLLVTIHRPLRLRSHFNMMMRPDNSEYYSAHGRMPERVSTPPDWPQEAVLRCDDPAEARARVIPALAPHLAQFTGDSRGKEIFLSPKGLRLVYRMDEGQRGHYLLTRLPFFNCTELPRVMAEDLLDLGHRIARSLEDTE